MYIVSPSARGHEIMTNALMKYSYPFNVAKKGKTGDIDLCGYDMW